MVMMELDGVYCGLGMLQLAVINDILSIFQGISSHLANHYIKQSPFRGRVGAYEKIQVGNSWKTTLDRLFGMAVFWSILLCGNIEL